MQKNRRRGKEQGCESITIDMAIKMTPMGNYKMKSMKLENIFINNGMAMNFWGEGDDNG